MKNQLLRRIVGCFRVLAERAHQVNQPGLTVWTGIGQRTTKDLGAGVAQLAHADEVADLEAKKEIEAGVAGLKDGKVDAEDLAHFRRAERLTARSAEKAHDISEVMKP